MVSLTRRRLALYSVVSVGFSMYAVWRAWNATGGRITHTIALMVSHNVYCFILMNLAFNVMLYFATLIQWIFFGALTEAESSKMWDRMVNYLLWKVLIVGAILEPAMRDLFVWATWFSIIGLMHTFCSLASERFKNLMTYSPNAVWWAHARIVVLLLGLLFADLGWFYLCLSLFSAQGRTQVFLLVYECFTLLVDTMAGLAKYVIHFLDLSRSGTWENRGAATFYTEVVASTVILTATLGNYLVILFLHGISLNIVDILIFVNIRIVFNNLRAKIAQYKNYRKLASEMDNRFAQVHEGELRNRGDNCAICREAMSSARRLPCNHIFHTACLRAWLEFNQTCPTCRHSLIEDESRMQPMPHTGPTDNATEQQPIEDVRAASTQATVTDQQPQQQQDQQPQQQQQDQQPSAPSVWTFNSNWTNWLPSLSVEVVRSPQQQEVPVASLYENPYLMQQLQFVRNVFPDASEVAVLRDLALTNSAELTINNILESRARFIDPSAPVVASNVQQQPRSHHQQPTQQQPQQAPQTPPRQLSSSLPSPASPKTPINPPSLRDSFGASPNRRKMSMEQRKAHLFEFCRRGFLEKMAARQQQLQQRAATQPSPDQGPIDATLQLRQRHTSPSGDNSGAQ